MLVHLTIKNLTVVKQVAIAFEQGMSAVTGETGAGKSIALDALGLCLGDRADSNIVRKEADKAEIIAHFDLSNLLHTQKWLKEQDLDQEESPDECFIRRIVSNEGRSKAFVNGIPVNLQQLKQLGAQLVNIHGQHDHHHLLKSEHQMSFLDGYAEHQPLISATTTAYRQHREINNHLNGLKEAQQQRLDRTSLLQYQVKELDEFSLGEDEFESLENEFKKASSLQALSESSDKICYLLKDGEPASAIDLLNHASKEIEEQMSVDSSLSESFEMLQNALIHAQEAYSEIDRYRERLEADPEHVKMIEERFSECLELARKHGVAPENLYSTHMALIDELEQLTQQEASLENLENECHISLQAYLDASEQLSKSRIKHAKRLAKEIQQNVRLLNMPHAEIVIDIQHHKEAPPSTKGNDDISFNISVNPGQQPDLLEKVVSGGELSRVGLVLQVLRSQYHHTPTLVFDEVDTGISGQTASVVGKLLQSLGQNNQVICVTHLPQVAARAQHQLFVNKTTDGKSTETQVLRLTKEQRVNEIARLLAGDEVTESAIRNAKELIGQK